MISRKVLALVLAGGRGTRLQALTREHAKPALSFAGGYRIVDFVLSNLYNSRIAPVYVLAQYKPHSLIQHLSAGWGLSLPSRNSFLEVVLPRRKHRTGFKGTADAVFQNLHLIDRHLPDLVAVFAADHIYRMDVRQMVEFHERTNADVSVAAVPVPLHKASSFGIIGTDADGRIREFQEKPQAPPAIAARPGWAYASMGNYLFKPEVLSAALREASERGEDDFGGHVLPRLAASQRAYAYDFGTNRVPGVNPQEEPAYWRDVGTVEAYRAAQRDVTGAHPRFHLWNPDWPILGRAADRNAFAARPEAEAQQAVGLGAPPRAKGSQVEERRWEELAQSM